MLIRREYGKFLEKTFCYLLVFVITPCFFTFEMSVVRPIVVKTYNMGATKHIIHIGISTFLFTNIIGNMMLCIFTDTTSKKIIKSEHYCDKCKMERSATTWHCSTCNACILRRDHHCFFFSRCIGLRNLRYYVLYLGYVFISLIYCAYHNYYYVLTKFGDGDLYLSAFKAINPFLRYLIPEPMGMRDLYVLFLFLNTGLVAWTGALFGLHMRNVCRGVTANEYKKSRAVNWNGMKRNFVKVFGEKWYLAVIWPFIDSPTK